MPHSHHPHDDTAQTIFDCLDHLVADISKRLRRVEDKEQSESSRGHPNYSVASLPAASGSNVGWVAYVSDGRKVGEGAGSGTGTLAYSDGTAWRAVATDLTVAS